MHDTWQKAYDELKSYIANNPSIEIGKDVIRVPDGLNSKFYQLFNRVRATFIKDNFSASLEKGYVLSKNWGEVSQAVTDSLKLESIDVTGRIKWFLLDPIDGLMQLLFHPLFDVLKGKKDLAAFEQSAAQLVEDKFIECFREGYQRWAIVSLIKLLAADKTYHIPIMDYSIDITPFEEGSMQNGLYQEPVPDIEETNKISFAGHPICSFIAPKIIVHSTRLDLFTAFRPDFYRAVWRAQSISPEREWYRISDIVREFGQNKLWPDLAIYTSASLKELDLIADYFKVARPDIVVECREEKGWYEKEGLELVKRHYNVLKPKLGSFVVCRESVPEAALKELEAKAVLQASDVGTTSETVVQSALNIRLLSVGYDITKLEPIIEAIIETQTKPGEAK